MTRPSCLRCRTATLTEAGPSTPDIVFFACPRCGRHYALRAGKQLTFRWLHPISLALYGVQYDDFPSRKAPDVVAGFVEGRPADQLEAFAREIRLELEEPTQQVRDILDCRASEAELRAFLERFAAGLEAYLRRG